MIDPAMVFQLFSDKTLLATFKKIVELRRASLAELSEQPDQLDEVATQMETLRSKKLVAEEMAPALEWRTYYLTADGLEMERSLKRLGS
jgi:hypothetical protein